MKELIEVEGMQESQLPNIIYVKFPEEHKEYL